MRSTIVPAQITTVEDRIAGNLTMAQLLILIAGFGLAAAVYLVMRPHYHFSPLKMVLILVTVLTATPLAIRIRGKIVADWLVVLTRFWQRPHRYAFTKNDPEGRWIVEKPARAEMVEEKEEKQAAPLLEPVTVSLAEHDQAGQLLRNPALAVRFVMAEKGGVDVSLTPLKR